MTPPWRLSIKGRRSATTQKFQTEPWTASPSHVFIWARWHDALIRPMQPQEQLDAMPRASGQLQAVMELSWSSLVASIIGYHGLGAVTATSSFLFQPALQWQLQDYVEDQRSREGPAGREHPQPLLRPPGARVDGRLGDLVQSVADLMGERLVLADAQGKIVADSQGQLVGLQARDDWRGRRVSLRSQEFAVGTLYISPASGRSADPRSAGLAVPEHVRRLPGLGAAGGLLAAIVSASAWPAAGLTAGGADPCRPAPGARRRGPADRHLGRRRGGGAGRGVQLRWPPRWCGSSSFRRTWSPTSPTKRTPLTSIRGYPGGDPGRHRRPARRDAGDDPPGAAPAHAPGGRSPGAVAGRGPSAPLGPRAGRPAWSWSRWEVRAFLPQAARQSIDLKLDAGRGAGPGVVADAGRIRQVLANLIRNAGPYPERRRDRGRVAASVDGPATSGRTHRRGRIRAGRPRAHFRASSIGSTVRSRRGGGTASG